MQPKAQTKTTAMSSSSLTVEENPLSADAEQLAKQLHTEAQMLAERYPAPNRVVHRGQSRFLLKTWWPVGGGVLAGGLALTLIVSVIGANWKEVGTNNSLPATADARSQDDGQPPANVVVEAPVTLEMPTFSAGEYDAAAVLRDVTGPELEGLLDLWENEEQAQTSISI